MSLLMCEFNNRTKEARPEDFIRNRDRSYYRRDLQRGKPLLSTGGTVLLYIKERRNFNVEVYERLGKLVISSGL